MLCKTITKVSYLTNILWIALEKGKCFDFNHSLGCVHTTLYILRLLGIDSSLSFQLADLLSMFISSVVIVIIIVSNTLALNVSQSRHAWRTGSTFSRHSSSLTAYSDWAHFQRSTVRLYEQRKSDFTKHHKFPLSLLPNYLRGVLSWRQGLTYSQEPPLILTTPDSV